MGDPEENEMGNVAKVDWSWMATGRYSIVCAVNNNAAASVDDPEAFLAGLGLAWDEVWTVCMKLCRYGRVKFAQGDNNYQLDIKVGV
jgi:hypothetical protein